LIRKVLLIAAASVLTFSAAVAQEPVTPLDKQLSRIDFAINGAGLFNKTVSGPLIRTDVINSGSILTNSPSNTVGALVTLRYVAKPFFGLEFNYSYARYTQNFSPVTGLAPAIGVQAQTNEYTIGYLVTPKRTVFGYEPFVSAGAGTMEFKPTAGGGLNLNPQARATYYYSAGLQKQYFDHIGFRAAIRENFFLAPDFGQNFLTIKQRTTSISPTFGFYIKF
jgi:hypothetical protein